MRAQEVLYRERHRIAARAGAGPWRVRVAWRERFACGPGGGAGDWRRGAQARLDAALLLVTAAAFGS